MSSSYDVVVVGGGGAGLSAALTLSRARRSVLVVDDGTPRNAPAGHVHNYLGREGTPPAELLAIGRAEVTAYGAAVVEANVADVRPRDGGFDVSLRDGTSVHARRVLVTAGLVDELPDVAGVAQRWGRDVLHCPYCHGWEVRDQRIGVLATGPLSVHQALLFRQWSADVTLLLHEGPAPGLDEAEQLAARGIPLVAGVVERLEVEDDRLVGVRLASGERVPFDAVVVAPMMRARSDVLAALRLEPVEMRLGEHVLATYIESEPTGATSVPGLYVAGNVADPKVQVLGAAAAGLSSGAAINVDLVHEDTARAVAAAREGARTPLAG